MKIALSTLVCLIACNCLSDFSKGVRGKHAARYAEGTNVVVLEADVAREFRTTEQVNETLRAVSKLLQQHRKRTRRSTA
jgi:hypothetical protein